MYEIAIVEAGNCVYCGTHIDGDNHIFLCEECRRKEKNMAKYKGIELYEKDGKFGVLVSPGYGAGWSTWYEDPAIAYDKRVIEFWLSKKDDKEFMEEIDTYRETDAKNEAKNFMESIGYPNVYMGGFNDITIMYVKKGVPWKINEYDGYETLETVEDAGFIEF